MAGNPHKLALEPAAQAFVDATSEPPFLYQLAPADGRAAVDGVQDEPIEEPEIDEEWVEIAGGPSGSVKVRIVRPAGATGVLPVVLYTHGAGWVFGDAHTHDRLVRDLAVGARAAVVFPEYDTLLAKQRGGVSPVAQVLFYPVTDAAFDTPSYETFAEGYFLARDGMRWFWDQYTTSESDRAQITASPLRAELSDLAGLPQALVITAEADVLRDEGEAYAAKLRQAGVPTTAVRYQGIVHDFVMVNSLHATQAATAAVAQAVWFLRQAFSA